LNTIYTCEGCGTKTAGQDAEELFNIGWDTPPRFNYHVTCPNCTIDKTAWFKAAVAQQELHQEMFGEQK